MKFNEKYFEKVKDIFGYHIQIKEINQGYRLYFNKKTKSYTIVNIFKNNEICHTFNSFLDINLNTLRFLKIENSGNVFKIIDQNNLNLEAKTSSQNHETLSYLNKETMKIINRSTSFNDNDKNKILGAIKC